MVSFFSSQNTSRKNQERGSRLGETHSYPDRRGVLRSLIESFISLFIAVLLFRTFAAEGYMISTGSMAPCLLGFHKRVECPTCATTFSFGVAYDTDEEGQDIELARGRTRAICPNCGQRGIDVSDVPRNHGDQLLVNKQSYLYRTPQRWEVVVFRNPSKATEAYVKRVVGMPGEQVQLSEGNILIDGVIARKNLSCQRAMRIPVHDNNHQSKQTSQTLPHWTPVAEDAVEMSNTPNSSSWKSVENGFVLHQGNERRPDREPFHWVKYSHRIRAGGLHETSVPLGRWPKDLQPSSDFTEGLRYDQKQGTLSCLGVLSDQMAQKITNLTDDRPFHSAIAELCEKSHTTPLIDDYGYNVQDGGAVPNPVRDVMFSCQLHWQSRAGEFAIQMTDGENNFTIIFNAGQHEIRLFVGNAEEPVATGAWPEQFSKHSPIIEVSLFDQQLLVAVNGELLIDPWLYETPRGTPVPLNAIRFGGRGLDLRIDQLNVYRDVYYTSARARHGVNRPYTLGPDEFFMLGDNSPVSHDSRRWDDAPVHRSLLLGKPFLVHLPSKPGSLRIGDHEMHLRIPDTERIKFLR
jgi:signal peptidase I